MKLSEKIMKLQEGGPMPAEAPAEGAPVESGAPAEAPQGGEEQLQQIAGQLVDMLMQQIGDPQAVLAILQMAAEMVAQAAQPAPTYQRQGGRLVRVR
jgi:hypothetical protein